MVREIVAVLILVSLLVFNMFELNRRRMVPAEFALWQFGIVLILALVIFQEDAQLLSSFIGFELLANFILTIFMIALLVLARIQSRQLGKLKRQLQDLVETITLRD
jgi:hypothetical protein